VVEVTLAEPVVALYANNIITSSSTPSCAITANGGNGGNGGSTSAGISGGGAGGSGGAGGWIYICFNTRSGPVIIDMLEASGGTGGSGGNGFGTLTSGLPAQGGGSGQGGFGGRIYYLNVPNSIGIPVYPPTSAIHTPQVLVPTGAQVDGLGRAGGISGKLTSNF
jgi:hypothetical protein